MNFVSGTICTWFYNLSLIFQFKLKRIHVCMRLNMDYLLDIFILYQYVIILNRRLLTKSLKNMQSGNTGKMNILKHPHKLHKVLNNSLSFDCSNVQCVDRALFRGFLCVLCLLCICVCCYNISNKYNLICDGVKVICYSGVHFTSHAVFH